jgi:hypothetical protein
MGVKYDSIAVPALVKGTSRKMSTPEPGPAPSQTLLGRLLAAEKGLLLVVPFAGYLILFVFQAGYLSYFSIPWQLIGFQATDILVAGVIVGVLLLAALLLLGTLLPLLLLLARRRMGPAQLQGLGLYLPALLAALLALVALVRERWPVFWLALFLAGWLLGYGLLAAAMAGSGRLRQAGDEVARQWQGTLPGAYWRHLQRRSWLTQLPVYLLLLLLLILEAGHIVAAQRAFFRVTSTSPEMVVVFQTEERVTLKPFDRQVQALDRSYQVLAGDALGGVLLRGEEVGPPVVRDGALAPPATATPGAPPQSP